MIQKISFFVFSALLLLYLIWPMPESINDFPVLPNSFKSQEPGDTYQISNVAGFYSNNYRDFVTSFYKEEMARLFRLPFLPLRLNYPPEHAFVFIKDQTQSTYLEEYVFPLKGSLFVNGFEPMLEDGQPRFPGGVQFGVDGEHYNTKVTLRFYPSSLINRLLVWLGVNLAVIYLWKIARKVIYG